MAKRTRLTARLSAPMSVLRWRGALQGDLPASPIDFASTGQVLKHDPVILASSRGLLEIMPSRPAIPEPVAGQCVPCHIFEQ